MALAPNLRGRSRKRAFTEFDTLLIFLFKSRDPQRFARKLVAIGGDESAPPISVDTDQRVFFFMPPNHRDEPEPSEPPLIEDDAA